MIGSVAAGFAIKILAKVAAKKGHKGFSKFALQSERYLSNWQDVEQLYREFKKRRMHRTNVAPHTSYKEEDYNKRYYRRPHNRRRQRHRANR